MATMFASLKSKIKDETGSDISKLTSSWRSGAFLGRITLRDDSSTASPSSSGGNVDSASDVKGRPLSKDETKALLEMIEKSRIITTKTTNATNNKLKTEEWYRITERFNATVNTSCRRTPQQLRLKWENLKKNARKYSTKIRMNRIKSLSPQLESYLSDRTGGQVDQATLHQQYTAQLETKLRDRDTYWEQKIEELKLSLASVQGEEAAAAQAVARTAQAEAAKAATERDSAQRLVSELRTQVAVAERAQDRLDALTEELEQSRREWSRERGELRSALAAAEARACDLQDQLALVSAALPPSNPHHHMQDDDKREVTATGCAEYDRVCRERAVLTRQLQEAKMQLADVKTSWSGQIASLETQVARLSRQAGEEGSERRRVEIEKKELQEKMINMATEIEKTKQNLINSEAKVVRLNGEVHSLAMEVKSLRGAANHAAETTMDLESRVQALTVENKELLEALENERTLVKILHEKVDKSNCLCDEQKAEVNHLNSVVTEMQHDYLDIQRKFDKEKREKDEALLRNAHMSQTIEMSQCNVRYQETEIADLKTRITELEALLAQHKENQAACMLIKEGEEARKAEIQQLKGRIEELIENETALKKTIQDLETDICDKNKKIKTLDNRIADMKKTLQRELQSSKSDLTSAEEQDISRRYLKHVVLRFLTARELEARQLTRALSVLLRLSAHEEALLRAALPPRSGLSAWFPSLTNT